MFQLHEKVIVNTGGKDCPGIVMDLPKHQPFDPKQQGNNYRVSFSPGNSQWIPEAYIRHIQD